MGEEHFRARGQGGAGDVLEVPVAALGGDLRRKREGNGAVEWVCTREGRGVVVLASGQQRGAGCGLHTQGERQREPGRCLCRAWAAAGLQAVGSWAAAGRQLGGSWALTTLITMPSASHSARRVSSSPQVPGSDM